MEKWTCVVCGYVYDEAAGDPDGASFLLYNGTREALCADFY